ncbi:MAG: hypothetical protein A2231_00915 [Candidatus Firestonebacteria bacterium RIFOXYA2_FULL_40_8]|nr:MAG: hypothetical protein A2231_00915 [Candidatus Firestonebacteria bacterium RIFOXYA2_FULL_40_8]
MKWDKNYYKVIFWIAASLAVLAGLFILKNNNYLLFHSTIEIFTVIVSFSIFIIVWNSRKYFDCDYFLFLGIGYFFTTIIDILHALSYKGMGIFLGFETNPATQFWISARYYQSIIFLVAAFIIGKRIKINYVLSGFVGSTIILILSILYWKNFPVCYIEGVGLTDFKVVSEYIISIIFLLSVYILYKRREHFSRTVFGLLSGATIITVLSEISFTLYSDPYGYYNLAGHYLKLVAFYLIYKAVLETGLKKPLELLFRGLKQSEEKYRGMVQDQTELICSWMAGGAIIFVNEAFCRYFGKKCEDLIGSGFLPLIYNENRKTIQEYLGKLNRNNPVESHEQRIVFPDGEIKWQKWTDRAIFDDKGNIIEVQSVGNDITEQKRVEELLKKNEELFRLVLNNSPISVSIQDKQLRYTWQYNYKSGYAVKDIIGKTDRDLIPIGNTEKTTYIKNTVLKTGRGTREVFEVLAPSGKQYFDTIIEPLKDDNNLTIGVTTVAIDITENRKIESEMERLATFPTLNPNPVVEVDFGGKVTYMNPSAKKIFPGGKILIKKDGFLQDWDDVVENLEKKGKNNYGREVMVGNSWYFQTIQYLPVTNSIRIYAMDISVRKKYEELLEVAYRGMEQKVAERTVELEKTNKTLNDEISERKNKEKQILYRNILQGSIIKLASRKEFLKKVIDVVLEIGGCKCAGIRILDEKGNIPYAVNKGYSEKFWESENKLSVNTEQCVCIRVITGKVIASDKKAMSKHGSFYCNNNFDFVKELNENEKKNFRSVCVKSGYASVAVIPIKDDDKIIGALHIADENENKFPLGVIESIESLGSVITGGIKKYELLDKIKDASLYSRTLIETSLDPLVTIDREGKIMDVSKATELVTGVSREKLVGTKFPDYFTVPDKAKEGYDLVFTEGFVKDYPLTIKHISGRLTDVLYNAAVYRNEAGEIAGVFAAARDITEYKKMEKKLAATQQELNDSKRLSDIGTLAATVAHELRNPLAAIRIAIYNVKRKANNRDLDRHVENIEKKIEESNHIINNLLFYSRIKLPQLEEIKVVNVLDECIEMAKKRFYKKKVKLLLNNKGIKRLQIYADTYQMNELFSNILNNAFDALPDKNGEITVESKIADNRFVKISIKDNGNGIEKENLEKIFDPFFTTKARGTGLGLSVCNQITYLHGGKIEVKSEVKKGTTLNIILPIERIKS